ncbi:DMT family transporter [Micromonospora sp. NBC_01655]|uniref:DMT family transporter n=1 Tax=Micromonospora sp. NBC_01655 TaxID=2975983 RepID=UPI002255F9C4|nr:DMT family transporter [Micromonospora sp. NBC_01655]MCX4473145.1 DMT family transporter [Micromonospora sp. NBC_01655]
MRPLPPAAALALVVLAGAASAAQGAGNAELGERAGDPVLGALVNNLGGCLVVLVGLLGLRSTRAGLDALRRARLPWWSYLGGLGGAVIVTVAAYVVPVLGIAVFTIAQVAGGSLGGLAADRAGLAPLGRLRLTGSRVTGALLGVLAVALAQLGRPIGEVAVGGILLAVAGGAAVALQSALNGRVSAAGTTTAGIAINFAVGTPVIVAVAALAGAFTGPAPTWPHDWYLYLGGLLGVGIVFALMLGVRAVGVLRTGLALVAGQLGGALLLDVALPGGAGPRWPVLVGALLTLLAVVVAGRGTRPPAPTARTAPAAPVVPPSRADPGSLAGPSAPRRPGVSWGPGDD